MNQLRSLILKLGANLVPLWGLALGGWSAPTALIIYWFDNFFGALLIALRIWLHQRMTHKLGHSHIQLGGTVTIGSSKNAPTVKTFFGEFLSTSLLFTLAHGLFLALLLNTIFQSPPENDALKTGILGVAVFELGNFLTDLLGLKARPFIWIKQQAASLLGHVILIHLAIIAGMIYAAMNEGGNVFFVPFAAFKLLADVSSDLSRLFNSDGSPEWMIKLLRRINPSSDVADRMARDWEKEQQQIAKDEEVAPHT